MSKHNLNKAKKNKNDEFYTQLKDIENEMRHYRKHFKNKVIYMNADDPEESNFWKFFHLNFNFFELKKIVATHYSYDERKSTYKITFDGKDLIKTDLIGNGDFRDKESIELLKEADLVITNPPFSLYREYIDQLMRYQKDFIVIGNFNSVVYKEVFPLVKDDKIWVGMSPRSMDFLDPKGNVKSINATWFTNLDIPRRNETSKLWRRYSDDPSFYPKYDNYDAIEVGRVADIPVDYDGYMGVPITYLEKHNPNEFEIMWSASGHSKSSMPENIKKLLNFKEDMKSKQNTNGYAILDGQQKYHRIIIKKRDGVVFV